MEASHGDGFAAATAGGVAELSPQLVVAARAATGAEKSLTRRRQPSCELSAVEALGRDWFLQRPFSLIRWSRRATPATVGVPLLSMIKVELTASQL